MNKQRTRIGIVSRAGPGQTHTQCDGKQVNTTKVEKNENTTEGERVTDLDGAGAAVDGRGEPVDCAIVVNQHIDVEGNIELTVVTVEGDRKTRGLHLV